MTTFNEFFETIEIAASAALAAVCRGDFDHAKLLIGAISLMLPLLDAIDDLVPAEPTEGVVRTRMMLRLRQVEQELLAMQVGGTTNMRRAADSIKRREVPDGLSSVAGIRVH